jgi:hypothetical protein
MNVTRFFLILAATCTLTTSLHAEEAKLGLPERRAIKEYQEAKLPELVKALQGAAKSEVTVEVDWNAVAIPDKGANYLDDGFWTNIFFVPTTKALTAITVDAMGAEAVKEKLKKVVFTFKPDTAPASNYPTGVQFADGVLTVNFRPYSNTDDVDERAKAIQSTLEAGL